MESGIVAALGLTRLADEGTRLPTNGGGETTDMMLNLAIYRCIGCNTRFAVEDKLPTPEILCPKLRCNCSLDPVAIDQVEVYMADEEDEDGSD